MVASDEQGMWLKVDSAVLDGIDRTATFVVAVPFSPDQFPRAWGFWNLAGGPKLIGPRHTNFTDGSICAFVPESGTWRPGYRFDALFNLYTVWALRHLHLEEFDRWPGGQFSPHPYYSVIEFKKDELCSCDGYEPPRTYGECCRPEHLKRNLLDLKADFERSMRCRITDRNPPKYIAEYMQRGGELHSIAETLALPAVISR